MMTDQERRLHVGVGYAEARIEALNNELGRERSPGPRERIQARIVEVEQLLAVLKGSTQPAEALKDAKTQGGE